MHTVFDRPDLRDKAHDSLVPQQLVCLAVDGDTSGHSAIRCSASQSRHQRRLTYSKASTSQRKMAFETVAKATACMLKH